MNIYKRNLKSVLQNRIVNNGFTLMEILVVLSIIAIMAMMAAPIFTSKIVTAQMQETFEMLDTIKPAIKNHYQRYGTFPANNIELSLPEPEFLIGNYVERIEIDEGAIHLYLGNKVYSNLKDKVISIRPQTVINSPISPISWGCGNSKPPNGMEMNGPNKTDVDIRYLPYNCR